MYIALTESTIKLFTNLVPRYKPHLGLVRLDQGRWNRGGGGGGGLEGL